MIITRTPFRISFAGGGSDLRDYYSKYGGSVVSTSINKYIYLSMHPYFHEKRYFLKYSKNELVDDVNRVEHKIIRKVFQDYAIAGVDFNSSADVPASTGLGSSSAFTVGLTNLCNAFTSKYMSQEDMAAYACTVEIDKLGEPIGKQDQYACAVGGINFIRFNSDESVVVEKILLKKEKAEELEKNLLLFYMGSTRSASSILSEQKQNLSENNGKLKNLHKMVELSKVLKRELQNNNVDSLGEILHAGWIYKRELASSITNETIDCYYNTAIKNGAIGGKLLGAGGGGFLLLYVRRQEHERLRRALSDLSEFQFKFETIGSTVIYYD
ncbi:MAG TPA: GHMP kinase [Nitrospirota bacterium]|nr:GHMP kinase [Nitrospirota bacterium]